MKISAGSGVGEPSGDAMLFGTNSPPIISTTGIPLIAVQHVVVRRSFTRVASFENEATMTSPAAGVNVTNALSLSYCHAPSLKRAPAQRRFSAPRPASE